MQSVNFQKTGREILDQAGFTLIEMVMVIVILGVIGTAGADFIADIFRGFSQTNSRLAIYEEGKDALVRMERELHNMLPNAICVVANTGNCVSDGTAGKEIRFGMILEEVMRSQGLMGAYSESAIEFPQPSPASLTDVNAAAVARVDDIVSLYNTSWNSFVTGGKLFKITAVAGNKMNFGGQALTSPSPQRRYYIVDRCVSYRWDDASNTLFRSVGTVAENGVNFSGSVEYPLAKNVEDFRFYYMAPSLSRNGIISVVFTMTKDDHDIVMHKEIHVKNVP